MLVEDDDRLRRNLSRLLGRANWEVVEAPDSASATTRICDSGPFDAALIDLVLPGGEDGFTIAARLKRAFPRTQIVAMSGYGDENLAPPSSLAVEAILRKPFDSARLRKCLARQE